MIDRFPWCSLGHTVTVARWLQLPWFGFCGAAMATNRMMCCVVFARSVYVCVAPSAEALFCKPSNLCAYPLAPVDAC